MNIKSLTSVLLAIASVGIAIPALASPAVLVGRITGSRVNVRSYPSTQAASPSYGLVGDRVEVLEQRKGSDDYIWYCVRFRSGTIGWVRSDLVRFISR